MAAAGVRDNLSCSVCREIFTDPVTLPCGHNFCLVCIERTWEEQRERREDRSCPVCRQTFKLKPELKKDVTLSKILEGFFSTPPEQEGAGNTCPTCDSPVSAGSSCHNCDPSQWDLPVQRSSAQSTAPSTSQRYRTCSSHSHMDLEFYCTEDGACICVSCSLDRDHGGHKVELLSEASEKKKEKLRKVLEKLRPEREETEEQIQRLQDRRGEVTEKAAGETKGVIAMFRDIREQLEALEKRLLSDISREQKKISLLFWDLIQELETKKDKLTGKIRHIEELCNMADPLTVLQEPEPHGDGFYGTEGGDRKRRKMEDAPDIGDLDVELISKSLVTGLEEIVSGTQRRLIWQEATDLELEKYKFYFLRNISEDRKTVSCTDNEHIDFSKRDEMCENSFFSTRSFSSGRHYWEVEGSGLRWAVGVSYRPEDWDRYDTEEMEWPLVRSNDAYYVTQGYRSISLSVRPSCRRIRISLDYEAGRLSFYELSDPIRHLHTFTNTFTEPLYAAFWADSGSVTITS